MVDIHGTEVSDALLPPLLHAPANFSRPSGTGSHRRPRLKLVPFGLAVPEDPHQFAAFPSGIVLRWQPFLFQCKVCAEHLVEFRGGDAVRRGLRDFAFVPRRKEKDREDLTAGFEGSVERLDVVWAELRRER